MTLPASHSSRHAHSTEHATAVRGALSVLPTPAWLHGYAEAARRLGEAVNGVLQGSSWKQPEQAARDARETSELLTKAHQAILQAINSASTYLARIGAGAVDGGAATWHGPTPQAIPPRPEPTVGELSIFVAGCRKAIAAGPVAQAGQQINQARSRLSGAAGVITPEELRNAIGALGHAQQACTDAAARLTNADTSLGEYAAGALGAPSQRGSSENSTAKSTTGNATGGSAAEPASSAHTSTDDARSAGATTYSPAGSARQDQ